MELKPTQKKLLKNKREREREKYLQPQSNHKETPDKFQLRSILWNASTLEKFQGHRRQGKAEKLSQIWGDWGEMTTKCILWFWVGSLKKKVGRKQK